jgi:hypothetical protein
MAFKKQMVYRLNLITQTTALFAFPPPFNQVPRYLEFVMKDLPQKKLYFERNFTFPNNTSNSTWHTPVRHKSIHRFGREMFFWF